MSKRNIDDSKAAADAELGLQAAQWLVSLSDPEFDPEEGFISIEARNRAFIEWVRASPDHLRVFLETVESHKHLLQIDAERLVDIEALLREGRADVITLHAQTPTPSVALSRRTEVPSRRRRVAVSAAALVLVATGVIAWLVDSQGRYTTSVGEQRTCKLEDGSFIYLNTDSHVEVTFSAQARNIRLVRGEALFVVEKDSARPFTVTAGNTTVRAVGTQFNVRRRDEQADVAVVEGTVQITTGNEPQRLTRGERVQIARGRVESQRQRTVEDAVAWRERRLVFHDAPLAEVAAEFNRYNRTKIRVEGEQAQQLQLSGIFDADRPQALMLYAAQSDAFAVEPDGNDWVIRAR
ncbi:FecR family protein [Steroidobacter sp.]|uniref:FecR family protein n=1 Tax=Steroidobacter sp. TaxID=1978227 RepID=UPI001A4DFF08|nr:FecR domain-containing protein [Steroidobacter sp.]MBL8267511.1 FecR domain-containing protein [Steroidobacter sp.]